ncbi:MAG: Hsp20/alpha crystallin family protein [Proteobacteria bacterium]|nr:Hsp20/alpha crystallin family protein [Pseudomonadota bacterium]
MNKQDVETKSKDVEKRESSAMAAPQDLIHRMEHLFENFSRDWRMPTLFRDWERFDPFTAPSMLKSLRGDVIDVRFDVSEDEKAVKVSAELPGIDEEDIDMTFEDGVLTIKGEKKLEKEEKDGDHYLSERHYGSFFRAFRVPSSVDESKIRADFDKGVLKINLPKKKEAKAKSKKIPIKGK